MDYGDIGVPRKTHHATFPEPWPLLVVFARVLELASDDLRLQIILVDDCSQSPGALLSDAVIVSAPGR